jgi:hypothetical protein
MRGKCQYNTLGLLLCAILCFPGLIYAAGLDALSISRGDAYGEIDIYKVNIKWLKVSYGRTI